MAPEATPRELEHKFQLAHDIIGSLQRAVRSRKLYDAEHVLHVQATDDLVTRFLAFFERYSYVRLDIRPDKILIGSRTLLQAEPQPAELPFRLYKDGLRELRFHRGLTREEILDFLSLLEMDPRDILALGEDMVSLIWTKDFRSIDYAAIDEFEMGTGETWAGLEPELQEEAKMVSKSLERITVTLQATEIPADAKVSTLEDEAIAERDEPAGPASESAAIPETGLEEVFTASLGDSANRLRLEIENETLGGAIRRSLEILVKLFQGRERSEVKEIGPLLQGVVSFYLRRQDFAALGHLLSKVQESGLIAGIGGGPRLMEEIQGDVRRDTKAAALLQYFNKGFNGDYEGLAKFFQVVGPSCVAMVASVYGRVSNIRTRGALRQYLIDSGPELKASMCRDLLGNAERCLEEVFEILWSVRPASAHEELLPYLKHANPSVRTHALTAAARCEGAQRGSTLALALDDADPKVRSAALKLMAECKDRALRVPLERFANDRAFVARDGWEKEAALRALGLCSGELGFGLLRELAERKPPMMNRAKHSEIRRAAILALAGLDSPPALAYLQLGLNSSDEDVRTYCQQALAKKR